MYAVPAERVDDFMQSQTLEARDEHGAVVA